jgi:hypothetical protein
LRQFLAIRAENARDDNVDDGFDGEAEHDDWQRN